MTEKVGDAQPTGSSILRWWAGSTWIGSRKEAAMDGGNRKYAVELTDEQRRRLEQMTRNGTASAKQILHARMLLMSDQHHPEGRWKDQEISSILGVHVN